MLPAPHPQVVHRDIKLENILLDSGSAMKIIDFGLAAFYQPGKRLRVHCGSPSYAAPEIVARKLYEGPPVDVWSLGVVTFAMVAGYLPFHASNGNKQVGLTARGRWLRRPLAASARPAERSSLGPLGSPPRRACRLTRPPPYLPSPPPAPQELCAKIIAGQYTAPEWLSPHLKDMLAGMLTTDPERRITLEQLQQHPWVRGARPWQRPASSPFSVRQDPATGQLAADREVLAQLEAQGYPQHAVLRALAAGECNYISASYYLALQAKLEGGGALGGGAGASSRAAPGPGPPSQRPSVAGRPASGPAAGAGRQAGGGYARVGQPAVGRPATAQPVMG
jgi:serine/threonine protein kinase